MGSDFVDDQKSFSESPSAQAPARRRKLLRPLEEYPVEILEVVLGILLAQKTKRSGGEKEHAR
jgi:hypothetical protein